MRTRWRECGCTLAFQLRVGHKKQMHAEDSPAGTSQYGVNGSGDGMRADKARGTTSQSGWRWQWSEDLQYQVGRVALLLEVIVT
jgi:hypothetical protein